jgi:hypothetical protein
MQPTNQDNPAPQSTTPIANGAAPNGTLPANNRQPVGNLRELFWQNVIREMLTSLSMMSMQMEAQKSAEKMMPGTIIIDTPSGQIVNNPAAQNDSDDGEEVNENLFDGRLAVITTLGTRIPIAEVHPLFACGVTKNSGERSLANAVECSVFQISTPPGEVYTLPLSEIRGFHSLSPRLVQQLQREAEMQMSMMNGGRDGETEQPFGFAAFTSLAKAEQEQNDSEIDRS